MQEHDVYGCTSYKDVIQLGKTRKRTVRELTTGLMVVIAGIVMLYIIKGLMPWWLPLATVGVIVLCFWNEVVAMETGREISRLEKEYMKIHTFLLENDMDERVRICKESERKELACKLYALKNISEKTFWSYFCSWKWIRKNHNVSYLLTEIMEIQKLLVNDPSISIIFEARLKEIQAEKEEIHDDVIEISHSTLCDVIESMGEPAYQGLAEYMLVKVK
ncbi:MAG: hypothetical protein WCP92_09255 [bacterium]